MWSPPFLIQKSADENGQLKLFVFVKKNKLQNFLTPVECGEGCWVMLPCTASRTELDI